MTDKQTPLENPLRLTVGNLKGGVARSTTSIMLALALVKRTGQRVLLVDAGAANGTSFEWSEYAGEVWPAEVNVVYLPSQMLGKRVREMWPEGHLIIDTGNDSTTWPTPQRRSSGRFAGWRRIGHRDRPRCWCTATSGWAT